MRLDWNDIKARAAKFAEEWKDAHYECGESQTFYNEFFELFGVTRRRVASFEHGVDLPEKRHSTKPQNKTRKTRENRARRPRGA
jgi:hypothetical protein